MQKKWRQYEQINEALHKRFGNRLIKKQNKGRRADKAFNLSNKISQNLLYLGEILVVGIFSFSTLIFGNGTTTPNNVKLVYPLQEVSTLDCRHQDWANLSDACKINLPIIENANYPRYEGQRNYTDIYTVLFGGNYKNGWAINEGSHYGIDIASAKGTPLYAIANGKVYFAGTQAGYGNVVKIQFVYNGVMYFATYGHMDQILVKTGQPVSIGQKLGTIGNSGSTMGGLGGYHVHFEINKGTSGKPVYPFYKCPDNKKSGIDIINEGLCRAEMFQYNLDPIVFLENANAELPHLDQPQHNAAPELSVDEAQARNQLLKIAQLYIESPYLFGGTGSLPGEPTDCSQYTKTIFAQAGIQLERNSADQATPFAGGGYRYETLEKAKVGDLVFFQDTYESKVPNTITHVAIYAGNNQLIHASADKVKISPFDQYWRSHFKGIGSFSLLARNYNKQIAENNYQKLNKIKNLDASVPSTTELVASTEVLKPSLPEQKLPEVAVHPAPAPLENPINQPDLRSGLVDLDTSKLDALGRAFFDEWNVVFTGSLPTSLKKGETANFQLHITKKTTGEKFNGILKQPIILVANSTNLSIDPVAISLVKDGEVQIKLKAQQSGAVYTAINLGLNKIGGFAAKVF